MLFRSQFGEGPVTILITGQLLDLPDGTLVLDKDGLIWKRTFKNLKDGGDMVLQTVDAYNGVETYCGAFHFGSFLPATVIHVPQAEECKHACQYAHDTGQHGSCHEVCQYLCVDEFPEEG